MINLRKDTIPKMLDIMEKHNNNEDIKEVLLSLLEHPDYQMELERYGDHFEDTRFTKDDFVDFFINIRHLKLEDIPSRGLRFRKDALLEIMDNIEHYRALYEQIKHYDNSMVEKALIKTYAGLPEGAKLDDIQIVINIGLGLSGGYVYKNFLQCDLKIIVNDQGADSLLNVIAHECHHMGFNQIASKIDEKVFLKDLDASLLVYLSGEGTAIKYCNNYEGLFTKRLDPTADIDVNPISLKYYLDNFDEIYAQLRSDIQELRSGKIKTIEELEKLFMSHYFYFDVEIDGELKENYLAQPVAYTLGADIWGLIHDTYGKEKLFELMQNPSELMSAFNESLKSIGREDLIM